MVYAYLCGTPMPVPADRTALVVQIPIKTVAVFSTTFIPYVEYLGLGQAFEFISATPDTFTPCLIQQYNANRLQGSYDFPSVASAVNQSCYRSTGKGLEVAFLDDYFAFGTPYAEDSRAALTALGAKQIYLAQQEETTAFGQLEWVEYVAALFNKEFNATKLIDQLHARYNCVAKLVTDAPPVTRKKVMWGNCYTSNYLPVNTPPTCYAALCPNYYCDLVRDAGGDLLSSSGTLTAMTVAQFAAMASTADVLVFTNANWNTTSQYNYPFFNGTHPVEIANLNAVRNKQVYDILGSNINDWFTSAKAEPGVLLMDLIQSIYGTTYIGKSAFQGVSQKRVYRARLLPVQQVGFWLRGRKRALVHGVANRCVRVGTGFSGGAQSHRSLVRRERSCGHWGKVVGARRCGRAGHCREFVRGRKQRERQTF